MCLFFSRKCKAISFSSPCFQPRRPNTSSPSLFLFSFPQAHELPPTARYPFLPAQLRGPENLQAAQPVTMPPPLSLSLPRGSHPSGVFSSPCWSWTRTESGSRPLRRGLPWPARRGPILTPIKAPRPLPESPRACAAASARNPSRAVAIGAAEHGLDADPPLRRPTSTHASPRSSAVG